MKIKTLIIITIFGLQINSYSQIVDYVEFPTDTAKWTQTITLQGLESGMPYTEKGLDYYILGDTIINGNVYQKVYSKRIFGVVDHSGSFVTRKLNLIGGIREDDNKRIYFIYLTSIRPEWDNAFYEFTEGEEYLLYDFNIEVGDTLDWMLEESFILDGGTNVLKRIDTIELYEDHYRRKFIFSDSLWYTSDIYWISGIGSSQGLFGPYRTNTGSENEPRLVCFNDNTNSILMEGNTRFEEAKNCTFLHDQYLEVEIKNLSELRIYPNPFSDRLKIEIPENLTAIISIYDISSKEIYMKETPNKTTFIRLPNLVPGVYILKVSIDGEEEIRKILKK